MTPEVVRNADESRFEASVGGKLALLTFHERHGVLALIHTEVPQELQGRHIGDALATAALDYARANGLTVKPYCQFVAHFIERHPRYADMVDPGFDEPRPHLA